jgi:NTE family protein
MNRERSFRWTTIALALGLLVLAGSGLAQQQDQDNGSDSSTARRPKIGLALGGGGARGAAHVGVLQVLEELNVPIDYVSGTSMGSIVGALFSIGLSPDEIQQEMVGVDWDDLFSDRPDRVMRNYRRKQDDTSFFLPVEFGLKDKGIVFSSGIIAGQKLGFAFRDPRLYLGGHQSFDNLAYPFRPVATDLATGEMFVMEKGNLLKAVRASMSIPGVFPPVEWEGRHLVDGYLARNLPADVVRDMGADIVIAVDVGMLPKDTDPEIFHTMTGVTEQQGIIQARQNVDIQLPGADVVIHVDLGKIHTRDFKLVPDAIPLGRQAALTVIEQLRELAVPLDEYRDHLQQHRMITDDLLLIDEIELVNNSHVDDRAILRNVHQEVGRPLDLDRLKTDLVTIFDFGVFELVDFEVLKDREGQNTLRIIANEKFYSPNIVNFGLSYAGGSEGRSYLDARLRITRLEMNRFGSELRTDFQIGRTTSIRSEYYQPLYWTRRPFFSLAGRYSNEYRDWYLYSFNLGEIQTKDVTLYPNLGYRLGHFGEVRFGIEYGHMKANDRTELGVYDFDGVRGGYTAELNLDMLDAAVFPTRGYRLLSRAFFGDEFFGSGLNYTTIQADAELVGSIDKNTFTLGFKGGSNMGSDLPEFDMFTAGGPESLEGYRTDEFRGEAMGVASLAWYRQIKGHPSPYSTSWYLGAKVEAGNAWRFAEDARLDDLHYCASLSLMAKTLLGPLAITYARAEDGSDAVNLTVGRLTTDFE